MNTLSHLIRVSVVVLIAFLLSSCGGQKSTSSSKMDVDPLICVALLPTVTPYDEANSSVQKSMELRSGASFLYRSIKKVLEKSKVARVVEISQLRNQIGTVSGGKLGAIKEMGKEARCDSVLMTTLTDFSQRQGGAFAVDSPASAAFEMQLIEAETGHSLWVSSFSETQTSLLNNLFSFGKAKRRGFKWITVEELVTQGVEEKMKECPYFY